LALVAYAALGLFLGWLLDSSSSILGQRPDRTTQVLMFLMCAAPAAAVLFFRRFANRSSSTEPANRSANG
jgi:hypothetical protein